MQALYKMVSSFLSVALIFTSAAPSFAQIRNTSRSHNPSGYMVAPNESTRTAFSAQVERRMLAQVQENMATSVDKEQAATLQEMQKIVFSAKFSQPEQAQENVDLKTLLPKEEFVRLYKNINQKVLDETLAKCTTEEDRTYVQEQWKKKTSSSALQSKYNQALANLQQEINQEAKAHLRYLSEQAVTLLSDSFKVNGQIIDIDPVAQFLPLMVPFGKEVLPKMVRTKATVILRKRLQNSAVKACKDETSCKRMLQNAAALAVLGTQQKDIETVAKVLKANHNGPAGASVISVLGPLLLAMNDIDPQYRSFSDMMSRVAEEEGRVTYWDIVGGAMSLETQLTAAHYMGAGTFALGYENSFYKANNKYKNLYNAWIDLGQAVAQESASNRALKNVVNNLLGGKLVGLQTAPKGHQQVVIKHPLFVTGLLSAGYQLDVKGRHAQTYLDAQGRAHQTADTRADWTKFNQGLKAANLTQSEGVALLLFKAGKANIDPYTAVYIDNQLAGAYKRSERTAQSVGMQKRTHPSAQEKSSYENWKTAQGVAGALDAVITVAAMVVLVRAVLTALPKILGSGAQTMRSIMKAARIARGGQATNISRLSSMQKVLRTAHYYKYGTYSRGSAFLKKARTSLGDSLGYRINMNELMPQKATYVRPTTTKPIQYTQVDMGIQNGQRTVAIATTPQQEATLLAQRTNIAPKTFASQGAPVANTAKVQPTMTQTTEAVAAPAASNTAAAPKVTPKWIWGKSTNSLGQTVPSMVPNPAHPEYAQILATQTGKVSRPFSWKNLWTDMQLAWQLNKPNFSQLFKFGTSRYGLAGLGTGAAPVTSEAAIVRAGNSVEIVQNIRAQQGMFIMEDALRGGAGAAYRTGVVNPGGVAAQQFAAQMLQTTNTKATLARAGYTLLNPMNAWAKAAALIPAGLLGTSLLFGSDVGLTDGLSTTLTMASMWGMPSFLKSPEERKKQALLDQLDAVVKQLETFAQAHNGLLPYYVTDCTEEEKRLEDLAYKYEAQLKNLGLQDHTIIQTYHELREQSFANNQRQLLRKSTDGASSETVMQNSNVETVKQQPTVVTAAQQLAKIYQGGNARTPKEQRKLDRTVKRLAEHLSQLEAFARKYNGRLPSTTATASSANYTTEEDASLINSVERDIEFLKGQGFQNDPLSQRYAKLVEAHKDSLVKRLTGSLDILEKFAREHDGKLPYKSNALLSKLYGTEQEIALREQVAQDIKSLNKLIWGENHDQVLAERCTPLFNRYHQLVQTHQQQMKQENKTLLQTERQKEQEEARQNKLQQKEEKRREEQERQELQKEWEEEQDRLEKQARIEEAAVRRQDKEWAQYEETLADETTADRAARVADNRIAWLGQTTEDFIVQLVNFYNNINPFGNTELNIQFNKPKQWTDALEKFIAKHHRAPMRYAEKDITSQEMKDEQRLAKAVYGLSDRLPADNPDKIRIDELFASVGIGMSKAEREQKRREQILAFGERGRAARLEKLRQAQVAQETTDNEQNLQQAEQEIQNSLQKNTAAQTTSQNWLDAQLDEIENDWSEEEDIYNAMRQTSSAQAAGQRRLSQDLDAAEQELLEQEMRAQDEADLNAALAQTSAAQANFQTRLEAELDAAEAELIKEEQQNKSIAKTEQTQTAPEITLSSLEKAISQFIALPMPFFLFEGILQNIFTSTDAKMAALADTHKRGRRPGYASLWLKTAEEEKYDTHGLGLVKLAKDKNSPLQVLFNLRETAKKQPQNKGQAQMQVAEPQAPSVQSQAQEQPAEQPIKKRRQRVREVLAEQEQARQQRLAEDPQFAKETREVEEERAQQAAKAPKKEEQPVQMMEEETALPDSGQELALAGTNTFTLLDGKTALKTYIPDWRIQLATTKVGFSNEQLDAIEQAMAATDEVMFAQDEDGNLVYKPGRNKDAWNYAEVFEHLLHETGIAFTKRQWGQIFGGKGIPDFTLKNYFTLLNLTAFLASQDKLPQKITATTKQEYDLRVDVDKVKSRGKAHGISQTDPIMQALGALTNANRVRREKRTPAQILAQLKQYMQEHNGQYPAYHAPAGSEEASLNNAITDAIEAAKKKGTDKTDPVIIELNQIKEDNRQFDIHKTALKWYASLKDWLATHNNKLPSQTSSNEKERQLRNGIYNTLATARKNGVINTDEAVIALNDLYENKVDKQEIWSTQKIYDEFVQYVMQHKRMPMDKSRLYYTLTARLYYHKKANKGHLDVNGNFIYDDPYLQKIYELKTAVQAAENGHLLLEKEGDHYVALAETEDTQESAENTQQAASAQKPQERTLILEINELTGQILEQVGAQAALQRTHYASWLRQAHDNRYIVGDDATYKVLFNVERMVQNYANLNIAQRTLVNDILDTLGQYQAFLGRHKGGFFYKIAYKGTKDTLLAQNFYLQAERTGWEWDADSPDKEIEKISEAMGNSGYLASLEEDVEEEFASKIVFYDKAEVTPEVAKKHLNDLLKVFNDLGYTVRMGTHELGLVQNKDNTFTVSSAFRTGRLHIHLEHAPDPEAEIPVGINIRFYIDASPFIGRNWTNDEIAANYFGLFRSNLTQEAKQALAQIVKSSAKAK